MRVSHWWSLVMVSFSVKDLKWLNVVGDLRRFLPTCPQIYAGKAIKAYINNIYLYLFCTVDVSIYIRIEPCVCRAHRLITLGASLHWSQIHPYTLSLTYIMYLHLSLLILSFEGFILFLFPSHFWLKSFQWPLSLEVCNPSIWTFPATLHMSQGHNWAHTWSNMRTISILDASFVPRFVCLCRGICSVAMVGWTTGIHTDDAQMTWAIPMAIFWDLFYSSLLRMKRIRLDYICNHSSWLFCL